MIMILVHMRFDTAYNLRNHDIVIPPLFHHGRIVRLEWSMAVSSYLILLGLRVLLVSSPFATQYHVGLALVNFGDHREEATSHRVNSRE